jgi:hypothetical protein
MSRNSALWTRRNDRTLADFPKAAYLVRQMLGIKEEAHRTALDVMGSDWTRLTIACLLEQSLDVANQEAYLRDPIKKHVEGALRQRRYSDR